MTSIFVPWGWRASRDGRTIECQDFGHDVILEMSGDFTDDEQRMKCAEEIAKKLNSNSADKLPGEDENGSFAEKFADVCATVRAIGDGLSIDHWERHTVRSMKQIAFRIISDALQSADELAWQAKRLRELADTNRRELPK